MPIRVLTAHRTCPPHIQARVARAGGHNRYGWPNFRVVWGWDRLTWLGGKWEDWEHDSKGRPTYLIRECYEYRQMPKYDEWDRWHVEKWMPPEFFVSPEYWAAKYTEQTPDGRRFLELGAFPHQGDYEHCFTIQNPDTSYLDLTPNVADYIVRAVERSRYLVNKDQSKNLEAIRERLRREQLAWDSYADDVLDDAAPAFGFRPFVTVAG